MTVSDKRGYFLLDVESSLRVSRCKQIVESLPEHHFVVTKFLLCFLHMVRQQTEEPSQETPQVVGVLVKESDVSSSGVSGEPRQQDESV